MIEPWLTSFPNFFDSKRIRYEFQSGPIGDWLTVIVPFGDEMRESPVLSYISRYYHGLGGSVLRLDCRFTRDDKWLELPYDAQAASLVESGHNFGRIIGQLPQFRFITFVSFSSATLLVHAALQEVKDKDLIQAIWLSPPKRFPWELQLPTQVQSLWIAGLEDPAFSMAIMRDQVGDRLFLPGLGHDLCVTGDVLKSVGAAQKILEKVTEWQGRINAQLGLTFAIRENP